MFQGWTASRAKPRFQQMLQVASIGELHDLRGACDTTVVPDKMLDKSQQKIGTHLH